MVIGDGNKTNERNNLRDLIFETCYYYTFLFYFFFYELEIEFLYVFNIQKIIIINEFNLAMDWCLFMFKLDFVNYNKYQIP